MNPIVPTLGGKVEITIPEGSQSGDILRLRGQGIPALRRRGRGDQLVHLIVETPRKLNGRQRELFAELRKTEERDPGPQHKSFFDKIKSYLKP